MSDQSLTLDAMWLLFGIVQSITLAFEGWAWVFTGLVAFAIYKSVARLGFAVLGVAKAHGPSPTLLLLRVFALGRRSERLFDSLSKYWLRAGSITMIAGPDLVTATVEPQEFLHFMGGELSRQFVSGDSDLEQRLAAMALGPDPDGRFRVNEFFCYSDTWQATMTRLASGADAILMDLRSFSPTNQGCLFEIEQLLDNIDLRGVVLLVDETTDSQFFERSIQDAWLRIRGDSPNRKVSEPRVRVLRLVGQSAGELRVLLESLLSARRVQGDGS